MFIVSLKGTLLRMLMDADQLLYISNLWQYKSNHRKNYDIILQMRAGLQILYSLEENL